MKSLLDANVLIALFDAAHVHHQKAHAWFSEHRREGWATCPLTQNACIRVISQPVYSGRLPVADITRRLGNATRTEDHEFWPGSLSLCDPAVFSPEHALTPKLLTDFYLLALAVSREARLVTFDRGIPLIAVPGTKPEHLLVL